MSNYLKNLLFSVLILAVPYMNSASKALDAEDDHSITHIYKIQIIKDDQNNVPSFSKQSNFSQSVNLEESSSPWGSYIISPFKASIQMAHEFLLLSTHNPKLAAVVGLSYIIPEVSAACECYCRCSNPPYCIADVGQASDLVTCSKVCVMNQYSIVNCTNF